VCSCARIQHYPCQNKNYFFFRDSTRETAVSVCALYSVGAMAFAQRSAQRKGDSDPRTCSPTTLNSLCQQELLLIQARAQADTARHCDGDRNACEALGRLERGRQ